MKLKTDVPVTPVSPNELEPSLLSINALNPWMGHDSSSRGTMFSSSHISQMLVVDGATPRRIQTGVENEFGKYTFKHKMPVKGEVIKVIPKYRQTMGIDSIPNHLNPTSLLVYEDVTTKEVAILELYNYSTAIDSKHQHFGFRYKTNPLTAKLVPGMVLEKGTVLADSPNVEGFEEVESYDYGVETNVACMGVPGIIEDGIVVSESYLKRISSKGFESRTVTWGKKSYPLNLYGDKDHYKPFPDIGEKIRDDGLLFVLRTYDTLLSPVEMDPTSLQQPDYVFDKAIYAEPNATVIDVNINHDRTERNPPTPVGMEQQALKYHRGQARYYREILEVYADLSRRRRGDLNISPEFHRLVMEAMNYIGFEDNPAVKYFDKDRLKELKSRRIKQVHRRHDIDDWRVEISFEYPVVPNISAKLCGTHGNKGVIVSVWDTESMPVDVDGNRAEMMMDGDSIIKRMNIGVLYEMWLNAASRDVAKRAREAFSQTGDYDNVFEYLMSYYRTVSPPMTEAMSEVDPKTHVDYVLEEGIFLWYPPNNPADPVELVKLTRDHFPPTFQPVTYAGGYVTDRPVLIGSQYILTLEKTGGDWSGVSSAKLQHFGIVAKVSNSDKYASPGRNSPIRILGESEIRLINAVVGSDISAELLDHSNNPVTHKAIVDAILSSDTPSNIERIVDRMEIPLGNSRSIQFVRHILECAGTEFVRKIDDPYRQSDIKQQLQQAGLKSQ